MLCISVQSQDFVTIRHKGEELKIYLVPAGNKTKARFDGSREFEVIRGDGRKKGGGK